MDFKRFLTDCGIQDPEILIAFLEQFSEDFDPSTLSEKEKDRLEGLMDRVLAEIPV
jgi:hypothetical protein